MTENCFLPEVMILIALFCIFSRVFECLVIQSRSNDDQYSTIGVISDLYVFDEFSAVIYFLSFDNT